MNNNFLTLSNKYISISVSNDFHKKNREKHLKKSVMRNALFLRESRKSYVDLRKFKNVLKQS